MDPAVFLDRDNTIIHNDGDLGDPEQVELIQGAASAIASLCGLGFKVVVVTNQGGVARGKYAEEDVEAVHDRIRQLVAAQCTGARIDRFYYCPYHPEASVIRYKKEHPWRKPQPGMLLQAAEDMGLDLPRSWMIGDQMRDIEAGEAAGVRTILLRADAEQLQPLDVSAIASVRSDESESRVKPRYIAKSLVEAVRIVAQKRNALDDAETTKADVPATSSPARKWDAAAVARLQRRAERDRMESESGAGSPTEPASKRGESSPRASRPFRPWSAPVEDEPESTAKAPSKSPPIPPPPPPAPPVAAVESPAESAPQPPAELTPDAVPPQAERGSSAQLATLRQILQELRNQREVHGEFTYSSTIVLVMLVVSVVCFLAALMLGGQDLGLFFKLMGTTIVILLACIVVLLLRK
jgi:D-glycero-D-manno-heptose 1,7-bisphosphate phosphatase